MLTCNEQRVSAQPTPAGLVLSTTSAQGPLEIDRNHCRALRMRKSLLTGGRLLDEQARAEWFRVTAWFVTLTYAPNQDWNAKQITAYMKKLFVWCRGHGITVRAEWCLELTRAGRPHYHVIVWLPKRLALPKPDKSGWWVHGNSNRERARSAVGYVAKYASKFSADMAAAMPKGARSHGVSGLDKEGKREVRWWKAPMFARTALGESADIRRAPGGYVDRVSGAFERSPWRVVIDPAGRITIHKVAEYTNESNRQVH